MITYLILWQIIFGLDFRSIIFCIFFLFHILNLPMFHERDIEKLVTHNPADLQIIRICFRKEKKHHKIKLSNKIHLNQLFNYLAFFSIYVFPQIFLWLFFLFAGCTLFLYSL